jgi:hypothetical protein
MQIPVVVCNAVTFQPSRRDLDFYGFIPALKCRAIVIASLRDGQTPLAPVVHPKCISHRQQPAAGGLKLVQIRL